MADPTMDCPKCGAPLEANEVQPGTVVHGCSHCFGSFYSKGELAVRLDLAAPKTGEAKCPRCRTAMDKGGIYDGRIELDRCLACGGFWFDAGEIGVLRRLSGLSQVVKAAADPEAPLPPLSAAAAAPATSAKPGAKTAAPEPKTPPEPKKSVVPPEMESNDIDLGNQPAAVGHAGRRFDHFQTSIPVTTYVLGEFPWVAEVGDTVRMSDFVCPPLLLSEETTKEESVWTLGEYIEPQEIWDAFKLPDAPPPKHGVAAAQPNVWTGTLAGMRWPFAAAAAACVLSYLAVNMVALRRDVLDVGVQFSAQDPEKSRVTDVFELGGRVSNVEIELATNLDNHWAEFQLTLIEAETDKAYDFGREISYYHGVEDGENWSEGSSWTRVYVPRVPPGRYYLRVEPETDVSPLNLHLRVRRDVPLARVPLLALALLGLPFAFALWQSRTFETARWMQSDHAPVSDEDDE